MWTFKDIEVTDEVVAQWRGLGYIGFVYVITNRTNDRKYIGKKLLEFRRTRKIKGKKKKVVFVSDWKEYYGSNEELKSDVASLGADKFAREILWICKSKGECNYRELHEQMIRGVLLNETEYYNSYVGSRIHRNHLKKM